MRSEAAARDRELRAAQREAAEARQDAIGLCRPRRVHRSRPAGRPAQAQASASGSGTPNLGASGTSGSAGGGGGQLDSSQQNASTTPEQTVRGSFKVGGGITVTLGGFVEAAGIFRSRNEVADIASNFNTGNPVPRNRRTTTRPSSAAPAIRAASPCSSPVTSTRHRSYPPTSRQISTSAANTANSNESNSYNLRLRQFYGTYDNTSSGLHVLGGQSWSLLTPYKVGIHSAIRRSPGGHRRAICRRLRLDPPAADPRRRRLRRSQALGRACRSRVLRRPSQWGRTAPA